MDDTIDDAFTTAVNHHQNGRLAEAARIYRLVVDVDPGHAAALNNLALIAAPDEAVELWRRALQAEPDYVDALVNLSSALHARGDSGGAAEAFSRALTLIPDQPDTLFQLAHLLHTQGRNADAARQYERAIALRPDFSAALCNLGTIHTQAEREDDAASCYRRALAIDPGLDVANLNMIGILEADGRLADAGLCRARLARPHPLQTEPAPEHRRTVLLVTNACAGNIPLDDLLLKRTNTRITWHADVTTEDQAANLPPHDVAFNAIGNADLLDAAYNQVDRFAAANPLLNTPAAVARTRRDRLPALLAGIPGLVVPKVLRLSRAEAALPDITARLAAAGIAYPVLVRPIAGHGGEGAHLITTAAQMAAHSFGEADAYYVIAYHPCGGADGFYRKYRTIFIAGQPYPYHLAISDHWLVHYFSAAMLSAPWKRAEEQRFLEDPAAVLGPVATAAITAIAHRLELDIAGIDFTLLPDGRVLLFEANATMLVHLRDSLTDFPYKHTHVPAIFDAFEAMLDHHATATRGLACPSPLP